RRCTDRDEVEGSRALSRRQHLVERGKPRNAILFPGFLRPRGIDVAHGRQLDAVDLANGVEVILGYSAAADQTEAKRARSHVVQAEAGGAGAIPSPTRLYDVPHAAN